MGVVTIQTAYPTSSPGALGAGIAPLISTAKFEVVVDIPDTIQTKIRYQLLRWNNDATAWFPVDGGDVLVSTDPSKLGGKRRVEFPNASAGYYVLLQMSEGTYAATAYMTELSGSGAAAIGMKGQQYTNLAAANTSAVHAAVQEGAANAFPGPITAPPGAAGRNVTATFAAGWQGGDITIVGKDQFGNDITEVIADNAGATVAGAKIFKTITSITKELAAGTTDTVTIGFGVKTGVPFQFTSGLLIQQDAGPPAVLDSATLDFTNCAFTPATAADGAHDYLFIGG